MSDQILMDNYLLVLKSTVEVYVHGTLESSNSDVRENLKECLDDTMKMQADTRRPHARVPHPLTLRVLSAHRT